MTINQKKSQVDEVFFSKFKFCYQNDYFEKQHGTIDKGCYQIRYPSCQYNLPCVFSHHITFTYVSSKNSEQRAPLSNRLYSTINECV